MNTRKFGTSATSITEVGLGTWQLGGTEWGAVSEENALEVLQKSFDAGIRFFDTADIYGSGRSETLIGKFLKRLGTAAKDVIIATKLGRRSDAPNGWPQNFTLPFIRQHTQDSLKRLGVERIFLQQFHCVPFAEIQKGEVLDHARTLQREGLIEHWGCSVETVEEGLYCIDQPGCAALQVIYNIFRQKLTMELLPQAHAKGVAILARVPLASGLLSGNFSKTQQFAPTDHRAFNANGEKFNVGETFAGVGLEKGVEFVEKIKAILHPTPEIPLATLALRWVLDDPHVTTVIPGATKVKQVLTNAQSSDIPRLSKEQHIALTKLYQTEIHQRVRGIW